MVRSRLTKPVKLTRIIEVEIKYKIILNEFQEKNCIFLITSRTQGKTMTTNTDNTDPENTNVDDKTTGNTDSEKDLVEKLVQERLEESLKDIKGKLDKAYGARDDVLKELATYKQKEKEAELQRLQDEGKHKEAYELQLAEIKAEKEALERRNVELTRDRDVQSALSSYQFRNEKAVEMARKEIVGQLIQNESGSWVHKSGISIKDFVKVFSEAEDNSFLFKAKVSNGTGSSNSSSTNKNSSSGKSLFEMSQEEVLKLATEGKLPRR